MPQIENEIIWLHDNAYTFLGIAHKLGLSEEEVSEPFTRRRAPADRSFVPLHAITTDFGSSENQAAHNGFVSSRGATTSPACHSSTFQLKM